MKKVISCVFSVNCSVFLCYVTANTEANFSTFLPNMVWRTCKWYNASFSKQVKQHKSPRAVRRFLLCHCHSLSIIQIPRFIGTPNTDQQMNSSYFMPSLILPLQIAIKDTLRFKLRQQAKVQGSSWLILVGCTYVVLRNCIGSQDTAKKMPNSYKPENFVFSRKVRENRYKRKQNFTL